MADKRARPTSVSAEIKCRRQLHAEADIDGEDARKRTGGSVLGQIHLDLAKYHEMQRFTEPGTEEGYDRDAALYHLRQAADCDHLEAIITMARVALRLPHDVLPDLSMECGNRDNVNTGLHYMHLVGLIV